ncbi:hypothetical protein [Bacillus sp. FJAT-45350]|uniref:hypothetical protein n=1 Tax=Bacillus sp. FJAT-45350 TaxID=2011014 RepID=UPI000BB75CF1|nr:hypothetical protein [Bacillus sp. FJAT-45350]
MSTETLQQVGPDEKVMSVKDWLITLIILAIPLVNIVMLFVWGFGSDVNKNKKNYCKATLLLMAILIAIYLLFTVLLTAILFTFM